MVELSGAAMNGPVVVEAFRERKGARRWCECAGALREEGEERERGEGATRP